MFSQQPFRNSLSKKLWFRDMKMTNFSSLSYRKAVNAPQMAGFTVIHQKELIAD